MRMGNLLTSQCEVNVSYPLTFSFIFNDLNIFPPLPRGTLHNPLQGQNPCSKIKVHTLPLSPSGIVTEWSCGGLCVHHQIPPQDWRMYPQLLRAMLQTFSLGIALLKRTSHTRPRSCPNSVVQSSLRVWLRHHLISPHPCPLGLILRPSLPHGCGSWKHSTVNFQHINIHLRGDSSHHSTWLFKVWCKYPSYECN